MVMKESIIRLIQARQTAGGVQTAVSLKIRTLFIYLFIYLFILAQQPPVGHGLLIHEVSRPHITTHHIQ